MKLRTYLHITATLLAVVAILHVARIAFHVPVHIGTWVVPQWLSMIGMTVTGTLSVLGFSLARQ